MSSIFPKIDEQIIFRAQAGDRAETEHIIRSYFNAVVVIANGYYNAPVEIDDLTQEGMVGLLNAIKTYDKTKGANFRTYSTRCIQNAMQNAINRSTRKKDIPSSSKVEFLEDEMHIDNELYNTEDYIVSQDNVSRIIEILKTCLSSFENEVLRLHIIGCSYNEIAEKLGKPPKAIDNALQRVRRKLAKFFTDFK
ncbi:MAG: sigma-70 family RNA polymerase sigma factor [Eubacterium sp.]|nr:sigma-70 family RNA polymerase sigma factor [Eubacterium sp.]